MTRTFLIPVDLPNGTPEELLLVAGEIEDACEAAGLTLTGPVHPWTAPTVAPPPPTLPSL